MPAMSVMMGTRFAWHIYKCIPSPHQKRWQACLVPNIFDMASMFGPLYYQHGKHTWFQSWLTWQAYLVTNITEMASIMLQACLVPIVFDMASIPGPFHNWNGKLGALTGIAPKSAPAPSLSMNQQQQQQNNQFNQYMNNNVGAPASTVIIHI